MQTKRNGGGIAPTHSKPGTGRRWVVSTTPRPLYPLEKSGTSCTLGCVDLGAGLDGTKNIAPTGIPSSEYINRTLKSEFFRLILFLVFYSEVNAWLWQSLTKIYSEHT
jgi:hypothetical protein